MYFCATQPALPSGTNFTRRGARGRDFDLPPPPVIFRDETTSHYVTRLTTKGGPRVARIFAHVHLAIAISTLFGRYSAARARGNFFRARTNGFYQPTVTSKPRIRSSRTVRSCTHLSLDDKNLHFLVYFVVFRYSLLLSLCVYNA